MLHGVLILQTKMYDSNHNFSNRLLKYVMVYKLQYMEISIIHVMIVFFLFSLVLSYDYLALPSQMRTNLTNMGVLTPTPIQMESVRNEIIVL